MRIFIEPVFCYLKHPEYDDRNSLNDIGILKLDGEVVLNSKIQLACLPDPAKPGYPTQTGTTVYAIGWGLLSYIFYLRFLVINLFKNFKVLQVTKVVFQMYFKM